MNTGSYYFDHDYKARNDSRILQLRAQLGWTGYALFFATLECLCETGGIVQRNELPGIAFGLMYDKVLYEAFIDSCIELGLLIEDERGILSSRIMRHLERRKTLSAAGRKGGQTSRKPGSSQAVSPPVSSINMKEIKETEDKKEDNAAAAVVVGSVKELRSIFFGEMFIDECCMRLHADKKQFTEFVHRWVAKKELDGNFMYTKPKLRSYLLSDWERELKTSKPNGLDNAKKMTKKIGEM